MVPAVSLQVIASLPTSFFHCQGCVQVFAQVGMGAKARDEELARYPADIREDAARLAEWMAALADRYAERIRIRVIDPQSPEGLYRSLRHWVRRYPTFLVGGEKIIGWDRARLEQALERHLAACAL